MEITSNNVNTLFSEGLWKLKVCGVGDTSRNGPVVRIPEPVLITLLKPQERVLFNAERDANPVFHIAESIWILAGRKDVAFLKQFNSTIGNYSDDGVVFNAAYGNRMRYHFGEDQLFGVINKLKTDPGTRQAVIQLWDPLDLNKKTLDRACNMQLVFDIQENQLNMLVVNRSNDFVWGCAGANAVHFSFLMEFVAAAVGMKIGVMRTVSNNLHFYKELYPKFNPLLENPPNPETYDQYLTGVKPMPIMQGDDYGKFIDDCENFCNDPFAHPRYYNDFFSNVAYPMAMVSKVRKEKSGDGMKWVDMIEADDWRIATDDWVERREAAKAK